MLGIELVAIAGLAASVCWGLLRGVLGDAVRGDGSRDDES